MVRLGLVPYEECLSHKITIVGIVQFNLFIDFEWFNNDMEGAPWCNGYRRRKCTRQHEFKSWTRLIAFHIALIPLGKV